MLLARSVILLLSITAPILSCAGLSTNSSESNGDCIETAISDLAANSSRFAQQKVCVSGFLGFIVTVPVY